MPLLAFDTAANACSAAVWAEGRVVAHLSETMERGHAERLVPLLQTLMANAAISFEELDAVAVTVGPGSFTGIRIGLATAKSLALAAQLKLYGISTFDVQATLIEADVWEKGPVLISLETKRDDFYVQLYGLNGEPLQAPAAVASADLARFILDAVPEKSHLTLAGDGARRSREFLASETNLHLSEMAGEQPDARHLAALADSLRMSGQQPEPVEPFYLRPPDVRRPADRG